MGLPSGTIVMTRLALGPRHLGRGPFLLGLCGPPRLSVRWLIQRPAALDGLVRRADWR